MMKSLRDYLADSTAWLLTIQNESDGGWGIYEESPTFILSTAEASLSLMLTGASDCQCHPGLQYLLDVLEGRFDLKAQYLRHYAWAGYALWVAGATGKNPQTIEGVDKCVHWLLDNQDRDGGWSHTPGKPSNVYATYLAVRLLVFSLESGTSGVERRAIQEHLDQAILWLVRVQNKDYGWGFLQNEDSNPSATAYGVLALVTVSQSEKLVVPITDRTISDAAQYLYGTISTSRKVFYEPNVASDARYPFHHFATPWVLLALVKTGYPIWDLSLWNELQYLFSLQADTGGWSESPQMRPTVWATHNAVQLCASLTEVFDPLDHLLTISAYATSQQSELEAASERLKLLALEHETEVESQKAEVNRLISIQKTHDEEHISLGYRSLRLQMSRPLFWLTVLPLLMVYIVFLSVAESLPFAAQLGSLLLVGSITYGLCHIISRKIMHWSTENTVQFGLAIVGVLIAIHLAVVGLP